MYINFYSFKIACYGFNLPERGGFRIRNLGLDSRLKAVNLRTLVCAAVNLLAGPDNTGDPVKLLERK